ncbi:hypothetical protein LXL04_032038 [Taraxacum kok-saghyz]
MFDLLNDDAFNMIMPWMGKEPPNEGQFLSWLGLGEAKSSLTLDIWCAIKPSITYIQLLYPHIPILPLEGVWLQAYSIRMEGVWLQAYNIRSLVSKKLNIKFEVPGTRTRASHAQTNHPNQLGFAKVGVLFPETEYIIVHLRRPHRETLAVVHTIGNTTIFFVVFPSRRYRRSPTITIFSDATLPMISDDRYRPSSDATIFSIFSDDLHLPRRSPSSPHIPWAGNGPENGLPLRSTFVSEEMAFMHDNFRRRKHATDKEISAQASMKMPSPLLVRAIVQEYSRKCTLRILCCTFIIGRHWRKWEWSPICIILVFFPSQPFAVVPKSGHVVIEVSKIIVLRSSDGETFEVDEALTDDPQSSPSILDSKLVDQLFVEITACEGGIEDCWKPAKEESSIRRSRIAGRIAGRGIVGRRTSLEEIRRRTAPMEEKDGRRWFASAFAASRLATDRLPE